MTKRSESLDLVRSLLSKSNYYCSDYNRLCPWRGIAAGQSNGLWGVNPIVNETSIRAVRWQIATQATNAGKSIIG